MINLEQSLPKEMLRTNKSGAYHCTTIVGCNTRKQHGLLVIPIPDMDNEAHVLLSSLDETVIQHGAPFNLGIHQYGEDIFSPNGHKYIREFNCDTVPTLIYRVGGVIMRKEKVFISHENRILIKYTLLDAHSATTLRFRPFLAFRNANALCVENNALNREIKHVKNGISCCLYNGYPNLFMQFNVPAQWHDEPDWYKGVEYYKDRNRGIPYKEDLWVPGYFELPISKGESVIFSAATFDGEPDDFAKIYNEEIETRTSRTSFFNCLKNSATQFYLKNDDNEYIMAGYPWYKVRARDEIIALPGCTLAIDRIDDFRLTMSSLLKALHQFYDDGKRSDIIHEIDLPDIPLWTLWALQMFEADTNAKAVKSEYGEEIKYLISSILDCKVPNLTVNSSGLVSTQGVNTPVSWMSASVNGRPIIPRSGFLVEFNALWYNALQFALSIFEKDKTESDFVDTLSRVAARCAESFRNTFLNEAGYLYDYVNGDYRELDVRPNMAIAVGLKYSPLNRRESKSVLDFVTRELLTPKGLRSLSPKSRGYTPIYRGNPGEREQAVHNGPARPWLFGFYCDAYFKVFGFSGLSFIERMLIGFEEEMSEGCIGSLSELYDGNPPYTGRGAVSTAKNVGEILRAIKTVKIINNSQPSDF